MQYTINTMKQLFLILLYLCAFKTLSATHIIGGSISYSFLGNNTYKIRLEVLRDCINGDTTAQFDDPASIGIFLANGILFMEELVPHNGSDTLSLAPTTVCLVSADVCVHKAIYETIVILPPIDGGYTIVYQRCCRSQILVNILDPLNTGITFHTHLDPVDENTSPVYNKDFPAEILVNTPFIYDGSAVDPDGDSLVYQLSTPFVGGTALFPRPQPPAAPPYEPGEFKPPYHIGSMLGGNYSLTIDSITGEMSAIPQTVGVFQIAYSVQEYRNGELIGTTYREFAFVVRQGVAVDEYDVNGSVYVNDSTLLDIGRAQFLQHNLTDDSLYLYEEQELGSMATYTFEDIPPGVFYIKAIVDTASIYHDQYLPTYYNSTVFWYNAKPINQCDSAEYYRDIHLIHVDSVTGIIDLDGIVTHAGRSVSPVPNLNLLLANENGIPIQARTTSEEGYFKFEHLPSGNYKLFVDLINSNVDNTNPPLIELTTNETIQVFLYEDSLSLQMPVAVNQISSKAYSINLYPNPATDKIIVEVKDEDHHTILCDILDVEGRVMLTHEMNTNEIAHIPISHLIPGIYAIRIRQGLRLNSVRFVKTK